MTWDENWCVAYKAAEHPHPKSELVNGLCPDCSDRLELEVYEDRLAHAQRKIAEVKARQAARN